MTVGRSVLAPLQAAPDAIQLDVFFLERPAEDHLLSVGIWKDIDQIGALPSETREMLAQNGFRIGHVSSNPPLSIQKLLGMSAEFLSDSPEYGKKLMGNHHFSPPGVEIEIPTGIEREHCELLINELQRTRKLEFDNVNCIFRMTAHRLQDGWVRVDFQPEIHYGAPLMRHTPSAGGWAWKGGQEIHICHSQRFSMTMNVGELALITSYSNDDRILGDRFFCRDDAGQKKQRVLVVRVVDSGDGSSNVAR